MKIKEKSLMRASGSDVEYQTYLAHIEAKRESKTVAVTSTNNRLTGQVIR